MRVPKRNTGMDHYGLGTFVQKLPGDIGKIIVSKMQSTFCTTNVPMSPRGLRFIFSVPDIVCGSLITCTSQSRRSPSFEDSNSKICCRSFLVTGIDTSIL